MPTRADISINRRTKISTPKPSEIFKTVETLPPLMRPQAARAYRGLEGNWPLTFANAQQGRSGEVYVYFNFKPHSMRMVRGSVSLRKYPRLKRLEVGTPVRVRGRIREVDTFFIKLDIQDLVFGKVAEGAH